MEIRLPIQKPYSSHMNKLSSWYCLSVYIAITTAMITSSFKFFISTVHIISNNENDNDNDNNNNSLRILPDSSTLILFNSVHQVML